MQKPIFVDAHLDLGWTMQQLGRDFRVSVHEKRATEDPIIWQREGNQTVGLPEALSANVGLVFATIYVGPRWAALIPEERAYETAQEAHDLALEQLAIYGEYAQHPHIHWVKTRADLEGVQATWGTPQHQIGIVTLMEGADPIRTPDEFAFWYEQGVRIVGLAWSETRYSGGTTMHGRGAGGLSDLGRKLLPIMAQHNAILDFSHSSEQAFYEALDVYEGQIIASHTNPRHFRDSDRHFTDDMIKRLTGRDGVIGLVPYTRFMHNDMEFANVKSNTPLSRYIDMIDYICQLVGDTRHVGIGSDLDGGFGMERIPQEIDNIGDFPKIAELLSARGYSDSDVQAICGGNFLQKIYKILA
jgi:membrane dipeptidase